VERALVIPGEYSPIHATAGGKAIFAFQDQAVIDRQLSQPLKKILPNTITDPALVRKELDSVRRQGYALTRSEFGMGVTAIAVPVDVPDAGVVYSIGMAGFESHLFDRFSLKAYVSALRHAAAELSSILTVARNRNSPIRHAK
jgi:DNA-binding IclR family transcriptional regulator